MNFRQYLRLSMLKGQKAEQSVVVDIIIEQKYNKVSFVLCYIRRKNPL